VYFCKIFHNLINGKTKVATGQIKNPIKKTASSKIKPAKRIRSAMIKRLFIIIPIKIEKPTNPSLYSFFQGRKNVLIIKGSEKTPKKFLFKDRKNLKIFFGASRYQNLRIFSGSDNIFIGQ
jgi:hypothetical protein